MKAGSAPTLCIEDLCVKFHTRRGVAHAVNGVSMNIERGETLGVVGESGSGKSVTALAVMRLLDTAACVSARRIVLGDDDLFALSDRQMRAVRGRRVSMISQDPSATLNPVFRVGDQIAEVLRYHDAVPRRRAWRRAGELLELVGIERPGERLKSYPHELSGGMKQRVVIAIALALEPELLLADEPTTALDVTVQAEILDLLTDLQERARTAMLMITHDMGVVARTCNRVAVMYAGSIVETGSVDEVLANPRHPYTRGLLAAVPGVGGRHDVVPIPGRVPDIVNLPPGCTFHPRCAFAVAKCLELRPRETRLTQTHSAACLRLDESLHAAQPVAAGARRASGRNEAPAQPANSRLLKVEHLVKEFPRAWRYVGAIPTRETFRAVDDVSFELAYGEALGVVGESGCGKSTTARMIMRLQEPTAGRIWLEDEELTAISGRDLFVRRRLFQMVFQNPFGSLDPRWTVERVIAEPLRVHRLLDRTERRGRVRDLLESVALSSDHVNRYPHQLSGGQRQRVAIARALALDTKLLVADEPVSSLDVSIQAQVIELLSRLKAELGIGIVFISHNLAVVSYLCDRVVVMFAGQIVEQGPTREVLDAPRHPYTASLVAAVPDVNLRRDLRERAAVPAAKGAAGEPPLRRAGCRFSGRCPFARDICRTAPPPVVDTGGTRIARCHLVASGEL